MRISDFKSEPPEIAYLDPSFLVNFILSNGKYHKETENFADKIQKKGTIIVLSNLGLDEIWYALLKALAIRDYKKEWADKLREPEVIKDYMDKIDEVTNKIMELPRLFMVEITFERTLGAQELMRKYGLLPRDAIHASACVASGVETMVTTDADFARVKELKVFTCNQIAFEN